MFALYAFSIIRSTILLPVQGSGGSIWYRISAYWITKLGGNQYPWPGQSNKCRVQDAGWRGEGGVIPRPPSSLCNRKRVGGEFEAPPPLIKQLLSQKLLVVKLANAHDRAGISFL